MRVMVIGGTRFIGPAAVRRLAARGHEVTVFHRGKSAADLPDGVQHLLGDRDRLGEYAPEFRRLAPEAVLDMIAFTEADAAALMGTFRGIARRVAAVSSGDVYRAYDRFRRADPGPPDPTPLTEDSPLRDRLYPYREMAKGPDDFSYHYEKILVERAVTGDPDLPGTVLRLPMVYGPGDLQRRLFPYLKRMDDGRPAILLSEGAARWHGLRGYVEDMGEAIARCVTEERAAGRVYHVADERSLTEAEWVRRIGEAAGWAGEVVAMPEERLPEHLRDDYDYAQDWSLDSSRIREELGYAEITDPGEAMRRTVEWERVNPPKEVDPAAFDYAAEDAALASVRH